VAHFRVSEYQRIRIYSMFCINFLLLR